MITDDPGFALMTYDPWYADNVLRIFTPESYIDPPAYSLTGGLAMPRNRPSGKRWLDPEQMVIPDWRALDKEVHEIFSRRPPSYYPPTEKLDIDPEKILVNEGSRHATPDELWKAYGLFKCRSPVCPDERKAAGLWVGDEDIERLAQPTCDTETRAIAGAASLAAGSLPSASLPTPTLTPSMVTAHGQENIISVKPATTMM